MRRDPRRTAHAAGLRARQAQGFAVGEDKLPECDEHPALTIKYARIVGTHDLRADGNRHLAAGAIDGARHLGHQRPRQLGADIGPMRAGPVRGIWHRGGLSTFA